MSSCISWLLIRLAEQLSYLNGLEVFPTFFNFSLNVAIRSSWSAPQSAPSLVFDDLYKTSPSLAAENIINLILVLTIWWCPCVEPSLVLLEEDVCYDQCFLLKWFSCLWPVCSLVLLVFALLHSVLQGKICLLLQVFFFTSYFCILVAYNEKDIFFGC